ncbi:MAG: 3-phosphoshikimate 1-carboxyvinyltransferase [Acidobacteriota bacterium]|nr:3-phosphoshikimate 1-carboxyvinyltransferase [Acidobacteriota bacterium]
MPESVESRIVLPAAPLRGVLRLPGDKSISHRYAMLSSIAEGNSEISGFASSADCTSTLNCLSALGIAIERRGSSVSIEGRGLHAMRAPVAALDAGNSGSTMRMLSGILAGQPFKTRITGDASLSRRPMKRIIEPLTAMGAHITAAEGSLPPLEITGGNLSPIHYQPSVASAQVKTAVLFAGLMTRGATSVFEPVATRNHTEVALAHMGASIQCNGGLITVEGPARLRSIQARVPGDISSSAFFIAAALLVPGSKLVIENAGVNPARATVLDVLKNMGGMIRVFNRREENGEPVADIEVCYSDLEGGEIQTEVIPNLIDELPIISVIGTQTRRGIWFRGASELRVKESDRLAATAENLRRCGAQAEEFEDGLRIEGGQALRSAEVDSFGDHRIAMAFAIAGLIAPGGVAIRNAGCVAISFPEFFEMLDEVRVPA